MDNFFKKHLYVRNILLIFVTKIKTMKKKIKTLKTNVMKRLPNIASVMALLTITYNTATAQNVGISPTGVPPAGDAGLDVNFTNKGLLIPRVSLTNTGTYGLVGGGPTTSMLVYNTNAAIGGTGAMGEGYYYWNGTRWTKLLVGNTPSDAWLTSGNAGTTAGTHFIGTTDAQDLVFKTNNTEKMRITTSGNVGIGTTAPAYKLEVYGGHGTYISVRGNMPAGDATHGLIGYNWSNSATGDYWRYYLADPDGGFGVIPGGLEIWEYPGNGIPTCCIPRFRIKTAKNQSSIPGEVVINENGDVGIGTATPNTKLHVAGLHPGAGSGTGASSDAPSEAIIPDGHNGTSRYNDWPSGWAGGLSTWDICGASIYMVEYSTRSDKRFKKEITSLADNKNNFINKFMQLRPVSYFIDPMRLRVDDPERKRFGFIANEIEDIFPNLVINSGMPDSIARGLEYDGFIPILVLVVQDQHLQIKEQQKMIEELKTENANLKSSNASQKKIIEAQQKEIETIKAENQSMKAKSEAMQVEIESIKKYLGLKANR